MKYIFTSFILVLFFIGCSSCGSSNQTENKETKNNEIKNSIQKTEKNIMADSTTTSDSISVAVIKTNVGTIEVELFEKQTPKTVENFEGLAEKNYYDGVIFHRVIDKFMIQGGDPTGTGSGGASLWGGKFEDEIVPDLKFDQAGILAMANAGPNTNGSQFFITLAPTPWLNGHHTIFGKVINGMDIVQQIGRTKTGPGDKPLADIVMEDVKIEKRTK